LGGYHFDRKVFLQLLEASVIPWEFLGSAQVPGNGGKLSLYKRGGEFSIRVDSCELMNSRVHGSEDALAELACARLTDRPDPRVLIGGLGMGYTLAAALRLLGSGALVVIAELVPEVLKWNQGPLAGLAGHPLQDKRVNIRIVDVGQIIQTEHQAYDAILLDVDNGPEGLARKGNDWLYSRLGLNAAFAALKPAGVLAVWSAVPNKDFARRLRQTGFKVDEHLVRARRSRGGGQHTIWIAERAS
jgi:spermidine synthase